MLARLLLVSQCAQLAVAGTTDVVVAHHDEDLAWLASVKPPAGVDTPRIVVYTKGEEEVHLPAMKMAGEVRALSNVGRESHSYLSHIVDHYDDLADWTVFTQAAAPSFGYRGHRSGGGHLLAGDSFEDYLTPSASGSRFIYTSVVELPSLQHVMRASYCINDTRVEDSLTAHMAAACPAEAKGWTEWWEVGWLQSYLSSKIEAQGGEMPLEFYREYIDSEHKKRDSVFITFAQGARFAVSRETIHSRPKAHYARILATLALDEDPYSGYYMEWMWSELFLGHTEPCTLPARLAEGEVPMSHQDAMDRLAYRYYKGHNGQLLANEQTPKVVPAQFRRRMQGASAGAVEGVSGVSGISGISGIAISGISFGVEPEPETEPEQEPAYTVTEFVLIYQVQVSNSLSDVVAAQANLEAKIDELVLNFPDSGSVYDYTETTRRRRLAAGTNIVAMGYYTTAALLAAAELVAAASDGLLADALAACCGLEYVGSTLCLSSSAGDTSEWDGECGSASSSSGLSGGAIAGIVIGSLAGVGIIGGGAFFMMKKGGKVGAA